MGRSSRDWAVAAAWLLAAVGLLLTGCDDDTPAGDGGGDSDVDGDGDADVDGDGDSDADSDADQVRRGRIGLSEVTAMGRVGSFADIVLDRTRPDGVLCGERSDSYFDCTITTSTRPVCAPACARTETCVYRADCSAGECVDPASIPPALDAGTVTITGGSLQSSVTCERAESGQYECTLAMDEEWWSPGDSLAVSAPGESFPAIDAAVTAPTQMTVTTSTVGWQPSTFDGTAPVPIEWEASEPAESVTVSVSTGGRTLVCRTSDDGSYEIPAQGLVGLGLGSMYTVTISRTISTVVGAGADGQTTIEAASGASFTVM